MNSQNGYIKSWILILISTFFIVTSGLMGTLICLLTQIAIGLNFLSAIIYFIIAAVMLAVLLYLKFENDLRIDTRDIEIQSNQKLLSDKIMKILTFLFLILFIISGIFLALTFIFAFRHRELKPVWALKVINARLVCGFIYFGMTGVVMSSLIFFKIKNDFGAHTSNRDTPNQKGRFDKIVKISTFILSSLFIISGILFSYICTFALPDRVPRPTLAILFFIGNTVVMSILFIRVKKLSVLARQ